MKPFVFLDIETTGIDPSRDKIVEIAVLRLCEGKIEAKFEALVNPGVPIPYEITLLTGITDEMLSGAPRFSEISGELKTFIADLPVVGHNIAFDTGFLKNHHLHIQNPEIDTIDLARILLPKESSYALEVLMKKYGLPLRASHRAMADTQTTVDFFEFLLGRLREIPDDIWEKMKIVLEKSAWAGKEIFVQRETKSRVILSLSKDDASKSIMVRQAHHDTSWNPSIISDFLTGKRILLESPHALPLSALHSNHVVIAYSSNRTRDELITQAKQKNISICQLKEPDFYISEKKLAQKISTESFGVEETPFLLKIILWSATTETGDREELSLEREDFGFFDELSDSEGSDHFWQKALGEAEESQIVLIHHYGLFRGLLEKIILPEKPHLIIIEASKLEESITNAFRKRFTETALRAVGEKAALAFGLLGIFYTKHMRSEWGATEGTLTINQTHRESIEWRRALEAFSNFPDHPKKNELIAVLNGRPGYIDWVHSFANELYFESAPFEISPIFHRATKNFSSILLQSQALAQGSSFRFIKNILNLNEEWVEQKETIGSEENRLSLQFPEHLPEPYSEGYFKACSKLFSKIIASSRGRALFLLSSKKAVAAMYSELLPRIKDTKLLAVGLSGGIGKSLALFLEDPENSVLLTTNQILPHLPEIEDKIDVIVFQKIPFDHPDNPLLKARSGKFANGFEEYTLPRAIMKFKEILAELSQGKTSKTCYLLDSRLKNRDYSQLFMAP